MLLRRALVLPFVSLAVTGPAAAQDDSTPQRLAAAIEAAGCVANGANADVILNSVGITEDQAGAAVQSLIDAGEITPTDEGLQLVTGACAEGSSPVAAELFAATQWAANLSAEEAGGFLAREITGNGCIVRADEADAFEAQTAYSVAVFHGVTLPGPVETLPEADYGAFIQAVDDLGRRGGQFLEQAGRLDFSQPGVFRLIGCEAPGGAATGAPVDTAALNAALLDYGTPELIALEAEVFAQIECMIPMDMGFAFQAMMLDRLLTDSGLPVGPDAALAIMAENRFGRMPAHPQFNEVNYAAQIVNEVTRTMIDDGRVEVSGRMLQAQSCTEADASSRDNLMPYLTGAP